MAKPQKNTYDDVKMLISSTLAHRLILNPESALIGRRQRPESRACEAFGQRVDAL